MARYADQVVAPAEVFDRGFFLAFRQKKRAYFAFFASCRTAYEISTYKTSTTSTNTNKHITQAAHGFAGVLGGLLPTAPHGGERERTHTHRQRASLRKENTDTITQTHGHRHNYTNPRTQTQ